MADAAKTAKALYDGADKRGKIDMALVACRGLIEKMRHGERLQPGCSIDPSFSPTLSEIIEMKWRLEKELRELDG